MINLAAPEPLRAFPSKEVGLSADKESIVDVQHLGMTIRDYFAAKAMAALISTPRVDWPDVSEFPLENPRSISEISYAIADRMLEVRSNSRKD